MIRFGPQNLRIPRFEKPVYVVAGGLTDYRKNYKEKNTCELSVPLTGGSQTSPVKVRLSRKGS